MWRVPTFLASLIAVVQAAGPSVAQIAPSAPAAPFQAAVLPAVPAPAPAGYQIAPGVAFVPQAFSEVGYDTNPNQAFFAPQGSAFIRSGAGFNFSYATPETTAVFGAAGSMLNYFHDSIDEPLRFDGGVKGVVSQALAPGLTLSSTGFYAYDGQSYIKTETGGGSVDLAYRNDLVSSVWRGSFASIDYQDRFGADALFSPLFLTSAMNHNRSEATWSALLGNSWTVSPYAEASAALVDYTDQPNPAVLNRSADDFHAKGGLRLTMSPEVSTDVGWRANWRETDDPRVTSFNSSSFDGSITWRPSPFFLFAVSAERFIGDPSTAFAVLADVRSYSAKGSYLPVPGVTVEAAGGWQVVSDIGDGIHYHSSFADARVAWDYNSHVQFYTTLHYQQYEVDWEKIGYDDLRILTGVRIIPDGQNLLEGESLARLFDRLQDAHRPASSIFSVSAGYSRFDLPDMNLMTRTGGVLTNQAIGQFKNGGGDLDGWRTDLRLSNFASAAMPDGNLLSFVASGFFANYQNSTQANCMYSLRTDCVFVNIVDTDPANGNNTGYFGDLSAITKRNVNYYGAAIETRFGTWAPATLKDGPAIGELSPFKVGVAMRGIDETARLTSTDPYVSVPLRYNESLNTHYYGGFAGFEQKQPVGLGWAVSIDATAGIFYADTEYQGRYQGYALGSSGYVQDNGNVNETLDRGSFIGTLRLSLTREFGWGAAGMFGQSEYLSYVPHILYNNNDAAGIGPLGVVGSQVGTRIKTDDAFNFTTGLSLSFRMN